MTEGAEEAGEPPSAGPEDPARRRFLALATASLGACAGAGLLGAVGTAVIATPLGAEVAEPGWYDLGPLERFAQGAALKVPVLGEQRDAWSRFRARSLGRVLVVREGDAVRVFSAACPHNGCDVFVTERGFLCPCHDSEFARDGALVAGESPRGLDPLDSRVEDGRLRVRLVRFQLGTAERRPV